MVQENQESESISNESLSPNEIAEELEAVMYFVAKRAKNIKLKGLASIATAIVTDNEVVFRKIEKIRTRKIPSRQTYLIISPIVPKEKEDSVRIDLLGRFSGALIRAQLEAYETIKNMLFGIISDEEKKQLLSEYREYLKRKKPDDSSQ